MDLHLNPYNLFAFVLISAILYTRTSESSDPPKLIVISFDGFRPDYVKPDLTPTLYKLAQEGVFSKHMKSVFGTKTFPNHMSIATGMYEESHGIIHNHMFDPVLNATFSWENTESRWWDNGHTLPIWLANQKHNDGKSRFSGGMMWPGTNVKIRGQYPTHYFNYSHTDDWSKRVDKVISWLNHPTQPANLVMMYFDEPDAAAHIHGPFSDEVMSEVKRADQIILLLLNQLKLQTTFYDKINLIILSDHGMAEISRDRVIILDELVNKTWYEMYGASPLWTLDPKPQFEDRLYETLKNASKYHHFSVYKKFEVPQEYHYRHSRRIFKLVVVADDGYDIVDNWHRIGEEQFNPVWGNHGYNNSLESMRPTFIAHGPAFRTNYEKYEDFENVDLYPLFGYVLEMFPISHYPSNGSISHISDILKPIVRHGDPETFLPILMVFIVGFGCICLAGTCFVVIAGFGKKPKKVELKWDPGVTEFEFGDDITTNRAINSIRKKSNRRLPDEEAVCLLEDETEN